MIRISLLGPSVVAIDGDSRPITAPKQRAVLAHLSLEPGLPQSADRLLDAIWGADQPAGGAKAVAFQVTKLRDALEPDRSGEGSIIRTTPSGYVLDVAQRQVDVHRVGALVADATDALADDPTKSGELAEEALSLWAGVPFADVPDSPVIDDERRRLELLHVRASSVLEQARLQLGDAESALPGLARLARQHPLDEHIAGLYMRTLDKCGRTADALRVATTLRSRLIDELGIDPSTELAELELSLISRAAPPIASAERRTQTLDGQLPRPTNALIGRDAEATAIVEQLRQPDVRALTLVGPGGVGKTRLATEVGVRWQTETDQCVSYCALAGLVDGAGLVDSIAGAVGFLIDQHMVVGGGLDERTQLLDYLALEPRLLVLDNAEHLDTVATFVADVIERCPDVTVLATSREPLNLSAEWITNVSGLDYSTSDAAAPTLFMARSRQAGADPATLDPADVLRACAAADGLPLAIELAAALAPGTEVSSIADRLERDAASIRTEAVDVQPRHRSLLAAFDQSWDRADIPLQMALTRLAVFPAPFDAAAAEVVAEAGPSTLARLELKSLIRRVDRSTFDLHPLIRQFAIDRLDDPATGSALHAHYYLDRLIDRTDDLLGSVDQMNVVAEVDREFEHIKVASLWLATQVGDDPHADRQLCLALHALSAYCFIRSITTWATIVRSVADTIEATLPDAANQSDAYLWARLYHSYPDVMCSDRGVDHVMIKIEPDVERLGPIAAAWFDVNRAISLELAGDVAAALVAMERSNESMQRIDRPDALLHAVVTSWHGWELSLLGRFDEAQEVWQVGLDHASAAHHLTGRAYMLSKVGLGADDTGDHELALRCHQESMDLFREAGDNGGLGYTLSRISWTHRMLGNLDDAVEAATQALECFQRVNHRWGIGVSLGRRAHAALDGGHAADAATDFAACISWGESKEMPSIVLYGLVGIGLTMASAGDTERAVELLAHNAQVAQNPYAPALAVPALAAAEERLAPDAFDTARRRGEGLNLQAAKSLARGYARELSSVD